MRKKLLAGIGAAAALVALPNAATARIIPQPKTTASALSNKAQACFAAMKDPELDLLSGDATCGYIAKTAFFTDKDLAITAAPLEVNVQQQAQSGQEVTYRQVVGRGLEVKTKGAYHPIDPQAVSPLLREAMRVGKAMQAKL